MFVNRHHGLITITSTAHEICVLWLQVCRFYVFWISPLSKIQLLSCRSPRWKALDFHVRLITLLALTIRALQIAKEVHFSETQLVCHLYLWVDCSTLGIENPSSIPLNAHEEEHTRGCTKHPSEKNEHEFKIIKLHHFSQTDVIKKPASKSSTCGNITQIPKRLLHKLVDGI